MRRYAGLAVLVLSVIAIVYLTCFRSGMAYGRSGRLSDLAVNEEQFLDLMEGRKERTDLLEHLTFEEETLFLDPVSGTFYYSLLENSADAYNPSVFVKSGYKGVKAAFLTDGITEESIRNNQAIPVLIYTDKAYCQYNLRCTTLPMLNIECGEEMEDESLMDKDVVVPMHITLFDNRRGAVNRLMYSDGTIHVRGASSLGQPKKGFRFSLTVESLGGHTRKNKISLLGLRQDEDWLLYAAYEDQEKIRNVFSSNLWQYSCAKDNAWGANTGMEYRYLELFINGKYWGLYALGFPIDEKQVGIDKGSDQEALFKCYSWFIEDMARELIVGEQTLEEIEEYFQNKWKNSENWDLILSYYDYLFLTDISRESLLSSIDLNNAIDIYLFFQLIQGSDNVGDGKLKNLYLAIKNDSNGLSSLFCPWDMNGSWGNNCHGRTYTIKAGYFSTMRSGYLWRLVQDNDQDILKDIFEKYWILRKDVWSDQQINALLDEYEADIYGSGAYLRDMVRWPDGGYADPADGLNTFREFVMKHIECMDQQYETVENLVIVS